MAKKEIHYANGTSEIIDLTAEEITKQEQDVIEIEADRQAFLNAKAQKEADALAGNNKLLELGLTQAQVTAMTGYKPE